jgi:CRP-like cAMP-binding protein
VNCSGCSGSARLKHEKEKGVHPAISEKPASKNSEIAASLLGDFSIFRSLDQYSLMDIISLLKLKKYPTGATVIKKGDPPRNLYIILSGQVDVIDENGVRLSTLGKGEVFGEMGLISGDAVGATIKVSHAASIFSLSAQDYKKVLSKFSSVQMYLSRLLAKRLTESNIKRAEEIASGMTGQLSDLSLTDLLQALNISQKTGVLMLILSKGPANLYLRKGNLVKADYNNHEGKQAIYEALKETEGRFKFNPNLPEELKGVPIIGSMMEVLLETSRRVDEDSPE